MSLSLKISLSCCASFQLLPKTSHFKQLDGCNRFGPQPKCRNFYVLSPFLNMESAVFMILFSVVFTLGGVSAQGTVLVNTNYGTIRGISAIAPNSNGSLIDKFLGIPFAKPPLGKLRFAKPESVSPWKPGVYNATEFKNVCMQSVLYYGDSIKRAWPQFSKEFLSEDCLYLNIYTPHNASIGPARPFPVVVHIHGGSFQAGTPVQIVSPGEHLPLREVILVGVQYRLGPFGFLATPDATLVSGNNGLLDQVAALKWIKENIAAFGGDADRITLLGESAGGASVGLHLLSPLSKGLFHQGIIESGVDFCPFAYKAKPRVVKATTDLAQELKCLPNSSDEDMLECLRGQDAGAVQKAGKYITEFAPTVDNNFLPQPPSELRNAGKFKKLPLIAGFVTNEGVIAMPNRQLEFDSAVFRREIEQFLTGTLEVGGPAHEAISNALEFQYTPWPNTSNPAKLRQRMVDLYSDYYITAPTHAVSVYQSQMKPVYMFEFSHRSEFTDAPEWVGVKHGDNLAYTFGAPLLGLIAPHNFSQTDRLVSDMVVTLYTNFIKHGEPTPQPVRGVVWRPFNATHRAYLQIREKPDMAVDFHPARVAFWNEYLPKLMKQSAQGNPTSQPDVCVSGATNLAAQIPPLLGLLLVAFSFFTLSF